MIVLGADMHKLSHTIAAIAAVEFPRFSGHLMACERKPRKDGVHHAEDPTCVSG